MIKYYLVIFIFFSILKGFSQKTDLSSQNIADSLKQNANAVIRLHQIDVLITSQRNMVIKTKKIVTIFNEYGFKAVDAIENYDKKTSINSIEAIVYDGFGTEIKKIKRKDFRDKAALDGITVFSDNRLVYLDYTATTYPYTIVYESEIETSNTAFISSWMPISRYFVSVEKGILNVNFPDNLGFKSKEFNFGNFKIEKVVSTSKQLSYSVSNLKSEKPEEQSPLFSEIFPKVMMGLTSFNLEGIDGNATSWKEFGQWYADKILTGTIELPEETKTKIKALVGNETDLVKKAKIIYKYVQEKSRYVSIQVGIGGWKPMLAKDVDRLGYGDCKALSNYTKALLNVVDVPSYNTVLYGDRSKRNIQSDFVSMQGNHMILCVPNGDKNIFLECTSQDDPFGFQGIFTDDRNVLIMKPDGGEIVHTTIYEDKKNTQISKGKYALNENGAINGEVEIVSEGSQYAQKVRLEKLQPTELEASFKEYWSPINNLKINKSKFTNDKEKISFTENVSVSAEEYGKFVGSNLIFPVNVFNQNTKSYKRIKNRRTQFIVERGFLDSDEITITLPEGFTIESLPQNFELKTKFGEYKTEIIKKDDINLVYKRSFFISKGLYTNTEYEECRLFIENLSRNDNAKIVLLKK
jgi:Domain of Unknown Function with PDB structure (DUF3857)